jgi:hypothetical protein
MMNVVRKMAYGAYTAFQKTKIHRRIKFETLAFGFALLLTCFIITNNIINAKHVSYLEIIDQNSVLSTIIVCLSIFYLLLFAWFPEERFNFERSFTMKLYGCKNKLLLRSFFAYFRESGFHQKDPFYPKSKRRNINDFI